MEILEKVIVVGSLNVDLTVYTPQFPLAGETVVGRTLKIGVGGKGNNQATAAHRSGGNVRMIGRMGQDTMGRVLHAHYESEGMSRAYVSISETSETGTASIEVNGEGQNRIVIVKGANAELSEAEVDAAEEEFADCGAVLTQLETGFEPILAAKRLAVKYHVPFILNPAPYQALPAGLLSGIDWLTPNETEAAALSGIPVEDEDGARRASRAILAMGVKNVVVTLGASGVYYTDGENEELVPAPHVHAVDTTGAGDSFNGAFAVALAKQMPVPTALRFANSCAALSVTRPGAAVSCPMEEETLAMLEEAYGIRL